MQNMETLQAHGLHQNETQFQATGHKKYTHMHNTETVSQCSWRSLSIHLQHPGSASCYFVLLYAPT